MKKKRIKVKKRKVASDPAIILNPTLPETVEMLKGLRLLEKTFIALQEKAEKSDIPFNLLETVYRRGYKDTGTMEGAFNRVNAYIAKGPSYHTLDVDLHESPRKDLRSAHRKRFAEYLAFRDGVGN